MASTVTATTYPSARNDATESSLESWMAPFMPDGVIWNYSNELALFADSTGMVVKLPSGAMVIGGVRGDLTSQTSLDIATANATNPRIDTVVGELTRTPSPYTIKYRVITGTPASSPVAPTLTNNSTVRQIAIGNVRVNASVSTIAAGNVTLGRIMTGDTGWQNWSCTPTNVSGSSVTIAFWTPSWARYRCREMTCEINVGGSIGLSGSNPGSLLLPLPFRSATNGLVLAADIADDARRCVTTFDSNFQATYALTSPIGSGTWPITSGLPLNFGGSFELYLQ